MSRAENEQHVLDQFRGFRERAIRLASRFVDDAEEAVDEATDIFERMLPEMAYVDEPEHPMASSLFICSGSLALYLALRRRGIDVHEYGSAVLEGIRNAPPPTPEPQADDRSARDRFADFVASGEASQRDPRPGEFVFEVFPGDRSELDWGMNVKSCAICHAFAKYDAMDLVPYMCATDDLMSDLGGQGLRRTGTIALGAHQCDFRYKSDREPLRLVEQYPDQIHDAGKR